MATAKKTAKKAAKKQAAKPSTLKSGTPGPSTPKSMPAAGRNPEGGLTAEGRRFFNQRDGSNLKPGVTGKADTPEKMKRKGSFLTRHFTHPRGPMIKDGEPTRLALSARAWGEPVPKTETEAKQLAAKGRKLLEQYHAAQEKSAAGKPAAKKTIAGKSAAKKSAAKKPAAKKTATGKAQAAKAIAGKAT